MEVVPEPRERDPTEDGELDPLEDKEPTSMEALLIGSFNVKNISVNFYALQSLLYHVQIICVQEHWLFTFELRQLKVLNDLFDCNGTSVDMNNPIPPTQKTPLHTHVVFTQMYNQCTAY
jgi:hypothetical protein